MKLSDFRIIEYQGSFKVQRRHKIIQNTGFWFFAKKHVKYKWGQVDEYGKRIVTIKHGIMSGYTINHALPIFDNFEDAEKKVYEIIKGEIIHEF